MKTIRLIIILTLVGLSSSYSQCMYEVPLAERLDVSTTVFEGKVLDKVSFWNPEHTSIFTAYTVEVYKVFKGTVSVSEVEVVYEGGIVDDEMEIVTPSLELTEGQCGVFMLQPSIVVNSPNRIAADLKFNPFANAQSFIKYDLIDQIATDPFKLYTNIESQLYETIQNHVGNNYKVIKSFDIHSLNKINRTTTVAPSISSFSPSSITGGTLSVLTINGSGFGTYSGSAKVEFRNVDDGGVGYITATAGDIVSWTANQIQVKVPSKGGTGTIRVTDNTGASIVSGTKLTVLYGQTTTGGLRIKLTNQNTAGGYALQYNTNFSANAAAVAAFERALNTWKCASLVNYRVTGTTTVSCQASDGIGVITFDNSCVLGSGTLATCFNYFTGCGSPTNWILKEWDMKISSNATGKGWNYGPGATTGGKYDLESVVLHELGHSQLETHVNDPVALMWWQSIPNNQIRTPNANEIACAQDVLSRSAISNSCGASAHIKLANCATTGLNEIVENNQSVSIYPNPFVNYTTLYLDSSLLNTTNSISFTLFDLLGNQITSSININSESFEISRNGLSNGIYFYQLKNEGEIFATGKLILSN